MSIISVVSVARAILASAALIFALISAPAQAVSANSTPRDLEAWSDWVLDDIDDYGCPMLHNANVRRCAWPGRLEFDLSASGGSFTQIWSIERETEIGLPGAVEQWPQDVKVNGRAAAVVSRNGLPVIRLDKGRYTINGLFQWQRLPESLAVPADSALVTLSLAGQTMAQVDIRNGQLWLNTEREQTQTPRRADIKVFRKVIDEVPLQVQTRIELDISGDQREISLAGVLLPGFEPASLDSRLPARLETGGALILKVRPGRWVVSVSSRLHSETLKLDLGAYPAPWPASELWVFESHPQLRLLKVERPASIDASQTTLPDDWKHLPAYRMRSGASMLFEQIRRGDPEPEPDRLGLERELWLDFDGGGYSVSDRINGTLSRSWRIDAFEQLKLGQVTLDGEPQLITRSTDGAAGVELRQGNIELSADSRIENPAGPLSATGWNHDFNSITTRINVPPGYRVLAISGADRSPATWLSNWTLLDFFIVLITTIALTKIHGKRWGLAGLAGFILLWHEPGAPTFIWLNLIATLAVMNALKNTRAFSYARNYLILSAVALALPALPFMVDQVREGIYPQLEYAWQSMGLPSTRAQKPATAPASAQVTAPASRAPQETRQRAAPEIMEFAEDRLGSLALQLDKRGRLPAETLDRLIQDPNARLQTGPGLPEWSWRSYRVDWNGPVQKQQTLSVYLVGPNTLMLLNFLRVFIVLLLAWKLLRGPAVELLARSRQPAGGVSAAGAASTAVILLAACITAVLPDRALADYPPQYLLQELKQRLLEPAECLPQCAEIETLTIRLGPDTAEFTLRAHAGENLAMPLPVPLNDWTPSSISVDGNAGPALFRGRDQALWLQLDKGTHNISVRGRIAHLRSLRLDFPLPPRSIDLSLDGWTADGGDSLSRMLGSLTFTRLVTGRPGDQQPEAFETRSDIPVFARLSRHIRMGLDWQVVTTVQLESGTALPVLLHIPLLPGEAVVSDGFVVEDGQVLVSLSETRPYQRWLSTLPQSDRLEMTAPLEQPWAERWQLEVTPIWHVKTDGIPVVYHQQAGDRWRPEWRPWPGESVTLNVSRPQGIDGQTKTIDRSLLTVTPGKRATAGELTFTLRSSQGQQHGIRLPGDAELESVSIDGAAVPVRQSNDKLTLPVSPGSQDIVIKWKQPKGIDWLFTMPDVDLGIDSVNARFQLNPGYDRWVLLAGGIDQGPAVLFWGVLIVILLIAIGLGRFKGTPLNTISWLLLGIGLSTVTPFIALLIAVWIFALHARGHTGALDNAGLFNAMQVLLALLTIFSVVALFGAVSNGLLGNPDMQIAGNGSTRLQLNWYQDRAGSALPKAWILSVPVFTYRMLMLAWSMWMAFALISWLKWGWGCYSSGRLWIPRQKKPVPESGSRRDKGEPGADG